jgi:hypothetical protein
MPKTTDASELKIHELDAVSGGMPNGTFNPFSGPLGFTHQGAIIDPPFPYPVKLGPPVSLKP